MAVKSLFNLHTGLNFIFFIFIGKQNLYLVYRFILLMNYIYDYKSYFEIKKLKIFSSSLFFKRFIIIILFRKYIVINMFSILNFFKYKILFNQIIYI